MCGTCVLEVLSRRMKEGNQAAVHGGGTRIPPPLTVSGSWPVFCPPYSNSNYKALATAPEGDILIIQKQTGRADMQKDDWTHVIYTCAAICV
jgi:hypothetical protein